MHFLSSLSLRGAVRDGRNVCSEEGHHTRRSLHTRRRLHTTTRRNSFTVLAQVVGAFATCLPCLGHRLRAPPLPDFAPRSLSSLLATSLHHASRARENGARSTVRNYPHHCVCEAAPPFLDCRRSVKPNMGSLAAGDSTPLVQLGMGSVCASLVPLGRGLVWASTPAAPSTRTMTKNQAQRRAHHQSGAHSREMSACTCVVIVEFVSVPILCRAETRASSGFPARSVSRNSLK